MCPLCWAVWTLSWANATDEHVALTGNIAPGTRTYDWICAGGLRGQAHHQGERRPGSGKYVEETGRIDSRTANGDRHQGFSGDEKDDLHLPAGTRTGHNRFQRRQSA